MWEIIGFYFLGVLVHKVMTYAEWTDKKRPDNGFKAFIRENRKPLIMNTAAAVLLCFAYIGGVMEMFGMPVLEPDAMQAPVVGWLASSVGKKLVTMVSNRMG